MTALETCFVDSLLNPLDSNQADLKESFDAVFARYANFIKTLIADSRISFWLYQKTDMQLLCLACTDYEYLNKDNPYKISQEEYPSLFVELLNRHVLWQTPVHQMDSLNKAFKEYFAGYQTSSALFVPVHQQEEFLGGLLWEIKPSNFNEWQNEHFLLAFSVLSLLKPFLLNANKNDQEQRNALEKSTSAQSISSRLQLQELQNQLQSKNQRLVNVISELQATQAHLLETEKLVALGSLVAGVAHEVNTPIGVSITAVSHLNTLLHQFEKKYTDQTMKRRDLNDFIEVCHETFSILDNNLTRAAEMVKNFKVVAVNQANDLLEDVMLKQLFEALIQSLKHETKKKKVEFELNGPADTCIKSYSGSLYQIFTNLILNSVFHGFEDKKPGECAIQIQFKYQDAGIEIYYSDNGVGLSNEAKQHILEPFFTTKRQAGGSGLGMHIVHNLIKSKLHGEFEILAPTIGFSCRMLLPKHF